MAPKRPRPPTFVKQMLILSVVACLKAAAQECSVNLRCGDCIGVSGCSWCSSDAESFTGARRCGMAADRTAESCGAVEDPSSQFIRAVESTEPTNPVNVTNVELKLRVGQPITFPVNVRTLRNLPLDLYILIDLSGSMFENLRALKQVAGEIANRIESITENVRIGFGSFNDKVTRPYTYFLDESILGGPGRCPQPHICLNYAFRHQITLTDNITFYNSSLQSVEITANADRPENGLEALAQVVACEEIIGWRDRGASGDNKGLTRVVLFMTDDSFHYAGEGQLAGIVKPYEGECLLEPRDPNSDQTFVEFTKWDDVDYPSIGQVAQMLHDKEVTVVFAVDRQKNATYQNLANLINLRSRASVANLEPNATTILSIFDTELRRFLQEVTLLPSEDDHLDFTITSTCPSNSSEFSNGQARGCDRVPLENDVQFLVTVTLNSCDEFQQPGTTRTHRMNVPGFGSFDITYSGECQCSCEQNTTVQSAKCNGNGDFECGICECYEGWCGPFCSERTDALSDDVCQRGGPNNELCSGLQRGVCLCSCECLDPFFGPACECDRMDNSCPRNGQGEHCNGQGDCCNGQCRCTTNEDGYAYRHNGTTQNCACPPLEVVCMDNNGTVCGDQGACRCNGCNCNSGFFGRHCQARDVGTCGDSMDTSCIEQCVNGSFDSDVCRSCEVTRPILVLRGDIPDGTQLTAHLEGIANTELGQGYNYEIDCEPTIGDCTYTYYLLRGPEMYAIILVEDPDFCLSGGGISLPFEPYIFAPIILGFLIILGIFIFILARIVIFVLDYLEVKRLEKETKDIDFAAGHNPLYQNPDVEYKNVAYGRPE